MKSPMPPKARDLIIAGVVMATCAFAWLVAPEAQRLAATFVVFGAGMVAHALWIWRKSGV